MAEPIAVLNFPPAWCRPGWALTELLVTRDVPGGKAFIVGGVLKDGTNLLAMAYPGGQRAMRCSPDTDWATEEHFTGRLVQDDETELREAWRITVEVWAQATRDMKALMGEGHGRN